MLEIKFRIRRSSKLNKGTLKEGNGNQIGHIMCQAKRNPRGTYKSWKSGTGP